MPLVPSRSVERRCPGDALRSHSYNAFELQRLFLGFAYDVYVACMAAVSVAAYVLYMRLWEQVDRAAPSPAPWHVVKAIPVLYAIHSGE